MRHLSGCRIAVIEKVVPCFIEFGQRLLRRQGAKAVACSGQYSKTLQFGQSIFHFEIDAFKKHCLLNGLDDIGLTMEKAASIDTFEASAAAARPWV